MSYILKCTTASILVPSAMIDWYTTNQSMTGILFSQHILIEYPFSSTFLGAIYIPAYMVIEYATHLTT